MKALSRRRMLQGLGAAMCCLPWGTALAARQHAATRQLNMTTRYELAHPVCAQVLQAWIQDIHTRSHDRLDIRLFPPNQLCFDADVYQCIQVDSISLGVVSPSAQVPPFPVGLLFDLVLDFPSAEVGSRVVWEMFNRCPDLQRELRMVHPLWSWLSTSVYIHTVKTPVASPADLQGLRLGVMSSVAAQAIQTLGGVPVEVPINRMAQFLKARLVEGVLCPIPPLPSFGLAPYLRFTTDLPLPGVAFFTAMNKEVWNALPPGDQRLLEQTCGERMAVKCGRTLDVYERALRPSLPDNGHAFVPVNEEQRRLWYAPIEQLRQRHMERLLRRGELDDKTLLETMAALTKRYAAEPFVES